MCRTGEFPDDPHLVKFVIWSYDFSPKLFGPLPIEPIGFFDYFHILKLSNWKLPLGRSHETFTLKHWKDTGNLHDALKRYTQLVWCSLPWTEADATAVRFVFISKRASKSLWIHKFEFISCPLRLWSAKVVIRKWLICESVLSPAPILPKRWEPSLATVKLKTYYLIQSTKVWAEQSR